MQQRSSLLLLCPATARSFLGCDKHHTISSGSLARTPFHHHIGTCRPPRHYEHPTSAPLQPSVPSLAHPTLWPWDTVGTTFPPSHSAAARSGPAGRRPHRPSPMHHHRGCEHTSVTFCTNTTIPTKNEFCGTAGFCAVENLPTA